MMIFYIGNFPLGLAVVLNALATNKVLVFRDTELESQGPPNCVLGEKPLE
jgi:hypothetical protein